MAILLDALADAAQMTHRKHHTHIKPLTASEWRTRYAEICKQYPDVPKAKRFDPEAVRQWEELNHAIQHPKPGTWRVVKIPEDPALAFAAIYSAMAGMK